MVNEAYRVRGSRVVVLMAAGLAVSLTACGTDTSTATSPADKTAGVRATSPTPSPSIADAPTYANCQELSKVFNAHNENQLTYLSERHWLIVSPSRTTYKIDLINDTACIAANPALARFVAQFNASQEREQRSECHATLDQLAAGNLTVGDKTADPKALRDYALSLCEPLGIAVPE